MQSKTLRVHDIDFVPAEFSGNESGYAPVGEKVLVQPDTTKEQTLGGVYVPEDMQFRMNLSAITGVVVAVGDDAWTWNADRTRPFGGVKPKVGDRVYFEKFAGLEVKGLDGKAFRLMDDKCIGAVKV